MQQTTKLSPQLRYKEFTLPKIQQEFAPRAVYDNGDSFIIHPLPQESPTPFAIPKTLPVFRPTLNQPALRLINPTIAFPVTPDFARSFIPNHTDPDSYTAFLRIGHLVDLDEHGPHHKDSPKYRLDLRDFATADAFQIIIHHHTSPTLPKDSPVKFIHHDPFPLRLDLPALRSCEIFDPKSVYSQIKFDRYIISECEYLDYWLVKDISGYYGDFRTKFINQYYQYLNSFVPYT